MVEHGGVRPNDVICQEAYAGLIGVPACVLADGDPAQRYYCGILCGPSSSVAVDDGECPPPLRCLVSIDADPDDGNELCSD